jgi:CheY-like chemotaxis protein
MPVRNRILLAEDTDVNARLIVAVLEKAGYEVTVAIDGVQAIKFAEIGDFDLVLMDVNMPEIDGLEATQRIRSGGAPMRSVTIIALTADDDPVMRRRCAEAGMNGYLTKPIDMATLTRTCERAIDQANRRSA